MNLHIYIYIAFFYYLRKEKKKKTGVLVYINQFRGKATYSNLEMQKLHARS